LIGNVTISEKIEEPLFFLTYINISTAENQVS